MSLQIDQAVEGSVCVLTVSGSLDTKTAPDAESHLSGVVAEGYQRIVIDFAALDYISSSGLRVLLSTMKKLKKAKGKMRLCGMNPTIKEVFDISGFSNIFDIHPTKADALNGF